MFEIWAQGYAAMWLYGYVAIGKTIQFSNLANFKIFQVRKMGTHMSQHFQDVDSHISKDNLWKKPGTTGNT